jgi:hypothetical protein
MINTKVSFLLRQFCQELYGEIARQIKEFPLLSVGEW